MSVMQINLSDSDINTTNQIQSKQSSDLDSLMNNLSSNTNQKPVGQNVNQMQKNQPPVANSAQGILFL